MGVMTENGSAQDVPNYVEAAKWYKKAGNLPQVGCLGGFRFQGLGRPR